MAAPACSCQNQNVAIQSAPCTTCLSAPEPVCGNDGYAPVATDPYLGGETVVPFQGGATSVAPDQFQSRRVDYDGAKIIHESPLPPGAKLVN
jgi:hypothetical protein